MTDKPSYGSFVNLAEVSSGDGINMTLPPQDIQPRPNPSFTLPSFPDSPEEPLQVPSTTSTPTQGNEGVDSQIIVTDLEFVGNTVFSDEELSKQFISRWQIDQSIAFSELLQIAADVTTLYHQKGYKTNGAIVYIPKKTQEDGKGKVEIRVIEGKLTQINISLFNSQRKGRLEKYLGSRLGVKLSEPLNVDRLLSGLQLLQLDPLIENISATITPGIEQGNSILTVKYSSTEQFKSQLSLNNARSPSVGSFAREISLGQNNLLGLGDNLNLGYSNSDGSNQVNINYKLPINSNNGTLNFFYSQSNNDVIEPPFNDLDGDGNSPDIQSESRSYEVSLRQPIIRTVNNNNFQEFSLSLAASLRSSQSFLLDTPFPLSPGADDNGHTRIAALRFSQEFIQQNSQAVIGLRSQFNLGINAFNSTINQNNIPGMESIPDSRFFSWQGQAQYVRQLAPNSLFLVRGYAQLSDQTLVSSEQFALGGLGSVRGYRQDQLLTDNGIFASAEVQLPIVRGIAQNGVLQLIPFVDYGTTWNSSGKSNPDNQTLSSVGMGLQLLQGNNFRARLDWGIPLVSVNSRKRTWQENGIYFTLQYNP
ncbi:MAG: ShlB/FhaC/HecB family hemolysin secretion/activation protein [Nostocales cyanobacterium 94392]|nr:ShlB/FhaC/HecB family hemolysin secretion/activation protein [Nostocales cyanobacterium 94392]